jgi:hypothetical protein
MGGRTMSQKKAEKTKTKAGGKKLTLRKETLRDLNPQTQQVKGGRLSQNTATGVQCSYKVSGCL